MTKDEFRRWIKKHEGYSDKPYSDTVGKITIGYGRNLTDNGISKEEADFLLDNDIKRAENELALYAWFYQSPNPVKDALLNMCFNMGLSNLLEFVKMIDALSKKDYTKAATEALRSKWAKQVGERAKDIAVMIRQGNE